jgi:ribosomal protein L21E
VTIQILRLAEDPSKLPASARKARYDEPRLGEEVRIQHALDGLHHSFLGRVGVIRSLDQQGNNVTLLLNDTERFITTTPRNLIFTERLPSPDPDSVSLTTTPALEPFTAGARVVIIESTITKNSQFVGQIGTVVYVRFDPERIRIRLDNESRDLTFFAGEVALLPPDVSVTTPDPDDAERVLYLNQDSIAFRNLPGFIQRELLRLWEIEKVARELSRVLDSDKV